MEAYNLINCNIITLNKKIPLATTLIIENGKITGINSINSKFPSINLHGATVIPGFIDAHYHLKNYGKRLNQINLKNLKSMKDIKEKIKLNIQNVKKNEWILGFGWDQNLWKNKSFPKKQILDEISPNNPIFLTRIDGHACWFNNQAIIKAKQSIEEINKMEGGKTINNCIAIDNAMNPIKNCLPKENKIQIKKWIKLALKNTVSKGITGVHDAWQDKNTIDVIKSLINNNEFYLRCYGMLASNDIELLKEYFTSGHFNSEYLNIRSVKAFIDGALGSRGAALHKPYCDDLNTCGLILISKKKFTELSKMCYDNNFQLNTHAIGDRGNSYVLNIYKQFLKKDLARRWRIEHAQMVTDKDLKEFKNLQVLPSMQPSHCTSDMKWLHERIGNNRLKLISRWQSFINLGLKVPGGSDCPIEHGNPIFEFYAAVTRQDHTGWPKSGWQSQEKVNRLNALKMFTQWAAYGGFNEKKRGTIDIEYDADLTILSDNLLTIPSNEILNIQILYTIINGKIAYKNSIS